MSAAQDEPQPQTEEEAEPQTPRSEPEPQTPRSAQAEAPLASFPLDELPIELKLQTLAHLAHGDLVRLRAVSTKLRDAAAHILGTSAFFGCLGCGARVCRPHEVHDATTRVGFNVSGSGFREADGLYVPGEIPFYSGAPVWHKPGTDLYMFRWHRTEWLLSTFSEDRVDSMGSDQHRLYVAPCGEPPCEEPPPTGWTVAARCGAPAPNIVAEKDQQVLHELAKATVGRTWTWPAASSGPNRAAPSPRWSLTTRTSRSACRKATPRWPWTARC